MSTGELVAAVAAGLTASAGITAGLVKLAQLGRRMSRFLDEFFGYHDGERRVAGFSERLSRVETQVREVRQQVLPNGGSSLRDAVDSIGRRLDAHLVEAADQTKRFESHLGDHNRP